MPQKKPDQIIIENEPLASRVFWVRSLLILLVLILCVGVALVMGVLIGRQQGIAKNPISSVSPCSTLATQPEANAKDKNYQEGYQAALKLARQKVAGLIPGMEAETHVLSGILKSIQDKNIVVTMDASKIDFFADGKVDKIFAIGPDIFVDQRVEKTVDQLNAEMKKYTADMDTFNKIKNQKDFDFGKTPFPFPPESFAINKIAFSNLKVGDLVQLSTKSNLESAEPFDAISIRLVSHVADLPNPTPPDAAPQASVPADLPRP